MAGKVFCIPAINSFLSHMKGYKILTQSNSNVFHSMFFV